MDERSYVDHLTDVAKAAVIGAGKSIAKKATELGLIQLFELAGQSITKTIFDMPVSLFVALGQIQQRAQLYVLVRVAITKGHCDSRNKIHEQHVRYQTIPQINCVAYHMQPENHDDGQFKEL